MHELSRRRAAERFGLNSGPAGASVCAGTSVEGAAWPAEDSTGGQGDPSAGVVSERRVTQADVARAAGLHPSTVSLALRGSSKVASVTRERIRRIATSVGFVPDPLMQAFVAHRGRTVSRDARATIAFVTAGAATAAEQRCLEGVRAGAAELGLQVERHGFGCGGSSLRRLDQILFHRSISGAILYQDHAGAVNWSGLALDRLSVVAIGCGETTPAVHRVAADHLGNARRAFHHAREAGCQRIGLVATPGCAASQALILASTVRDAKCQVPAAPFVFERTWRNPGEPGTMPKRDVESFARWLWTARPDGLIAVGQRVQSYLEYLGVRVPHDLALFDLDRHDADRQGSGMSQNHHAIGAVAVAMLGRMLERNARGLPELATRTLVPGLWCSGRAGAGAEGCCLSETTAATAAVSGGERRAAHAG